MNRQGFFMFEACIYVAVSMMLVYILFASVSHMIIPLQKLRRATQKESVVMAVLSQIMHDVRLLAPQQIVSLTHDQCIWLDAQNHHRGWVFQKDGLYYYSGVFSPLLKSWSRVRRNLIIKDVQGSFETIVYKNRYVHEYACTIFCNTHKHTQAVVLRNGAIS